jgi:hypothetical protein
MMMLACPEIHHRLSSGCGAMETIGASFGSRPTGLMSVAFAPTPSCALASASWAEAVCANSTAGRLCGSGAAGSASALQLQTAIPEEQIEVPEGQIEVPEGQIEVPEEQIAVPEEQIAVPEGAGAFRPMKSGLKIEAFRPGPLATCVQLKGANAAAVVDKLISTASGIRIPKNGRTGSAASAKALRNGLEMRPNALIMRDPWNSDAR